MQVTPHEHARYVHNLKDDGNVHVSVLHADAKAILRWEGYLCKHTYAFVLIDSISFHAYHH